jgi:hypothetical protein
MIDFAAQRLMELKAETLCGAGHGERNESPIQPLRTGARAFRATNDGTGRAALS